MSLDTRAKGVRGGRRLCRPTIQVKTKIGSWRRTRAAAALSAAAAAAAVSGGGAQQRAGKKKHATRETKRFARNFSKFLVQYCNRSSLHGLRYIVDPQLHRFERFVWLVLFVLSSYYATHVICMLAARFEAAPTSTVIESATHRISAVPFPSVTICPNDRVDWRKVLDLETTIFGGNGMINDNSSETATVERESYLLVLAVFSNLTFGDFHQLNVTRNLTFGVLSERSITAILEAVVPSCEDLFSNCWWRYGDRNCCELLRLQRTEYGFCYSFNSKTSEYLEDQNEPPLVATDYGEWTGLRVTIRPKVIQPPPDFYSPYGIITGVTHPGAWPRTGLLVTTGHSLQVQVQCTSGYATERVLQLDADKIPCKYIENKAYYQESCYADCRREHVIKYCGCNPSFFFPSGVARDCTFDDIDCLVQWNDVFNNFNEIEGGDFNENSSMSCDCPPECEYYMYTMRIASTPVAEEDEITMDIFFEGSTTVRYKTDVIYTNLDLLVSFGGIIGLFLGGSLLSAAELMYAFSIGVISYARQHFFKMQPGKVEDSEFEELEDMSYNTHQEYEDVRGHLLFSRQPLIVGSKAISVFTLSDNLFPPREFIGGYAHSTRMRRLLSLSLHCLCRRPGCTCTRFVKRND
ncbi:pickpocket protein 19 [Cephus cinctus]|uniref:Pickpocket protein 19 n=1 Tax=Cephus cinctus TaxID=211228 RepID=A0AAJ7RVN0_CEPCN|nr:pickpocket protein 19 [Cephus cinctus]